MAAVFDESPKTSVIYTDWFVHAVGYWVSITRARWIVSAVGMSRHPVVVRLVIPPAGRSVSVLGGLYSLVVVHWRRCYVMYSGGGEGLN